MKIHNLFFLLTLFAVVSCGGASGVRETLGLKKKSPDEFMVLSRPPLVVPPDFNLPPPESKSPRKVEVRDEAKKTLFGNNNNNDSLKSQGENVLLNKAGASADTNIRDVIDEENSVKEQEEDKNVIKVVLKPIQANKQEPVIDADAEQKRLDKNKAEGKPVTEGETPEKNSEDEGILNKIID